jgi:hypothetical protein
MCNLNFGSSFNSEYCLCMQLQFAVYIDWEDEILQEIIGSSLSASHSQNTQPDRHDKICAELEAYLWLPLQVQLPMATAVPVGLLPSASASPATTSDAIPIPSTSTSVVHAATGEAAATASVPGCCG